MIDQIFNWCVALLYSLANITGISYEALNVYLFVIINPGLLILAIIVIVYLYNKYAKLKKLFP